MDGTKNSVLAPGPGAHGDGPSLLLRGVRKAFADVQAVDGLDLELETIEQRVADAEREMQVKHDALLDPAIMSDGARLHAASLELEAAQQMIDELYARWVALEAKLK